MRGALAPDGGRRRGRSRSRRSRGAFRASRSARRSAPAPRTARAGGGARRRPRAHRRGGPRRRARRRRGAWAKSGAASAASPRSRRAAARAPLRRQAVPDAARAQLLPPHLLDQLQTRPQSGRAAGRRRSGRLGAVARRGVGGAGDERLLAQLVRRVDERLEPTTSASFGGGSLRPSARSVASRSATSRAAAAPQ